MMLGIDISDYQICDSFHDVAADGISFIYCKATQGVNNIQGSFLTNRQRINEVPSLMFGAYHYLDWQNDSEEQAAHFLSMYDPCSGDLPPMLDIEEINVPEGYATEHVVSFIGYVENHIANNKMILYMNWDTINSQKINTSFFSGHPLWLAQYAPTWNVPNTWNSPTIWQYSESGQVGGVNGTVDLDKALVDLALLKLKL